MNLRHVVLASAVTVAAIVVAALATVGYLAAVEMRIVEDRT